MKKYVLITFSFLVLLMLTACNSNPDGQQASAMTKQSDLTEFEYGIHTCAWTGDLIETVRYGAVFASGEEKLYFNSVESLTAWMLKEGIPASLDDIKVVDFIHGKALIHPTEAVYLNSKLRPSPGKLHLSALDRHNDKMLGRVYEAYPGPFLEWDEMVAHVAGEWGLSIESFKAYSAE